MMKFLVTHSAVIGRTKEDGSDHPPVDIIFYTIVEGKNEEAARDQLVRYSDPGFRTHIEAVTELGDQVSVDELQKLLDPTLVIKEQQE